MNYVKSGQFLTFRLGSEDFGVPISLVKEINQVVEVTPVPKAPDFVKGVMNLRGKIVPVVDLRVRFGLHQTDFTKETCIIVIDTPAGQVGNIVDAVKEVLDFTAAEVQDSPRFNSGYYHKYVVGLGKKDDKVFILVNLIGILDSIKVPAS